jgi:hypothetical protein
MRIDANLLKPGYQTLEKNGLYAEFHPDGQLAHLGYDINGQAQGWTLTLNPDQCNAWDRRDRPAILPASWFLDYGRSRQ